MTEKNLFQTIGLIDDDLVEEAANLKPTPKRFKTLKIAAVAAAVVMLLGATGWTAKVLMSGTYSSSSNIPSYYEVPTAQVLQEDIGIAPLVVEEFANGYTFQGGYIVENEAYSSNGERTAKYKSLHCEYQNGEEQVALFIDSYRPENEITDIELDITNYKGCELQYYAYANKLVPGDYQLTEQDQQDEQSGKYVFSYGSDEIEISAVQSLVWHDQGLSYSFCAIDSELTQADLLRMAQEIIDLQP